MQILQGQVSSRSYGAATNNYRHLEQFIRDRLGLTSLRSGTLNVQLGSEYVLKSNAEIEPERYNGAEILRLQRCVVAGLRAVIIRPHTHEPPFRMYHGPTHLELMSGFHLRTELRLETDSPVAVEVEGDDAWWESSREPSN